MQAWLAAMEDQAALGLKRPQGRHGEASGQKWPQRKAQGNKEELCAESWKWVLQREENEAGRDQVTGHTGHQAEQTACHPIGGGS